MCQRKNNWLCWCALTWGCGLCDVSEKEQLVMLVCIDMGLWALWCVRERTIGFAGVHLHGVVGFVVCQRKYNGLCLCAFTGGCWLCGVIERIFGYACAHSYGVVSFVVCQIID